MITKRARRVSRIASTGFAVSVATITGVIGLAESALGQERREVTVDVDRCLEIQSEEARQACFAEQVDQVLREREQPESEGNAGTENQAEADIAVEPANASDDEIFGTIVEMREYLPSAYIIRLDNGQIWEQTEPKQYPIRVGLEVRIYPTRWGNNYRLTGLDSGGRHIQVRRVR